MKSDAVPVPTRARVRKHLSADALIRCIRHTFEQIPDHRSGDVKISLADALMSGFALFFLKEASLLAFDGRRKEGGHNLKPLFRIGNIPSDTRLREICDEVSPQSLRPSFNRVFRQLQRGKALEPMVFLEGHYLVGVDGTGHFSSHTLHSPSCLERTNAQTGEITYYQMTLGAAIIHPDFEAVIPLIPEMIIKQDGQTKNDCERNAARRFLEKLRKDHPHLKLIITEDALSPNAPHIRDLIHYNCRFILGVKPGDHTFLFNQVDEAVRKGKATEFLFEDEAKLIHYFRFLNGVSLNESNQDILVNFLEYWEVTPEEIIYHNSWVTDFTINRENAYPIIREGRYRWKMENENFNTLKNQGYHFGHNYGLGEKHLSTIFVILMMLVFLVDQTQQLCCTLFQSVWKKTGSKRALWDRMRALFETLFLESMQMLYRALLEGYKRNAPEPIDSS
jgi:hypothetical protein